MTMATIAENLQTIKDSVKDIKQAIIAKGGTVNGNLTTYANAIKALGEGGGSTPSTPAYTGHADVEGLKAIGWTDEDIAYYQANGVNWNEEEDQYHKVPEDNIALYGVLTANNISTYADRIVYLPKIDTSSKTSMYEMFFGCYALVFIPQLDTSKVTNMSDMFWNCTSLVSIPQLDTSKVTNMSNMFANCYSLVSIPQLDTSKVTHMSHMLANCYSLVSIPQLDTSNVAHLDGMFAECYSLVSIPQLDTSNVTEMSYMFANCYSLVSIPQLDTSKVINSDEMFFSCNSLQTANLKNLPSSVTINNTSLLSKSSLLYIINNASSSGTKTITLSSYCYDKYSTDADIVAALNNHTNISLAK